MSLKASTSSSASVPTAGLTGIGGELCLDEVECSRVLLARSLSWYFEKLTIYAQDNSTVATIVHNVIRFEASPQTLLQPSLVGRVLAKALSRRAARNRSERLDAVAGGAFWIG